MKTPLKTLLVAGIATFGLIGMTQAAVINFNVVTQAGVGSNPLVTMDGTAYSATAAPASYVGTSWNDSTGGGAVNIADLLDSEGNSTGAGLSIVSNPRWSYDAGALNALDNYMYNVDGDSINFTGLGANTRWDVYVLADDNNATGGGSFTIGSTTLASTGASNLGAWTENANFVKFGNVKLDGSGALAITMNSGVLNGLQLSQVFVPEPSTVVLLGLGSLILCGTRRRKSVERQSQ